MTDFAVIVADRNGTITEWTSGAERILGWMTLENLGRNLETILTAEDRAMDRI